MRGPSANGVTTQDSTDHINGRNVRASASPSTTSSQGDRRRSARRWRRIAVLGAAAPRFRRRRHHRRPGAGIALDPAPARFGWTRSAWAGPSCGHRRLRGARRRIATRCAASTSTASWCAPAPKSGLRDNLAKGSQGSDAPSTVRRRHADRGQPGDRERPRASRFELGERLRQRGGANGIRPQCMAWPADGLRPPLRYPAVLMWRGADRERAPIHIRTCVRVRWGSMLHADVDSFFASVAQARNDPDAPRRPGDRRRRVR